MAELPPGTPPAEPSSPPPTYDINIELEVADALTEQLVHTSISPLPGSIARRPSRPRRRSSLTEFHLPGHSPEQSTSHLNSPAQTHPPQTTSARNSLSASQPPSACPPFEHPFAAATGLLRRSWSDDHLTAHLEGDSSSNSDDDSQFSSDAESFRVRPSSIASVSSHRSSRRGVLLEDRSARATNCFAKSVAIPGFYPVGEKAGGFVVFDIEITSREGTILHALKRYSAFVQLRNELYRQLPHVRAQLPPLPPKSGLAKFRPTFLEKRRVQLAWWLQSVCLHPEAGSCTLLKSWILDRT